MVSADGTSAYTYDATSQLTAADHSYQTDESYSYDANGNRTLSGYDTGDNNQLLSDGTYDYTYDDEGNRLTRTHISSGHVTAYEWDHRNRLISVTDYDDSENILQLVAYRYDLFNRRLSRALDTTSPFDLADVAIERFVYDDLWSAHSVSGLRPNPFHLDTSHSNVVLDFVDSDGSGASPSALRSRHLFGAAVDQLLAQEDVTESLSSPDRVLWPLADHLQTTRDLSDNAGDLREHYEYDSFGQILSGDTSLTRFLFTAREHDPATALHYHRARHHDPAAGRWISEDPMGFEGGDASVVRYNGNRPADATDPSGLERRTLKLKRDRPKPPPPSKSPKIVVLFDGDDKGAKGWPTPPTPTVSDYVFTADGGNFSSVAWWWENKIEMEDLNTETVKKLEDWVKENGRIDTLIFYDHGVLKNSVFHQQIGKEILDEDFMRSIAPLLEPGAELKLYGCYCGSKESLQKLANVVPTLGSINASSERVAYRGSLTPGIPWATLDVIVMPLNSTTSTVESSGQRTPSVGVSGPWQRPYD